ncbi:unnamed protein product [Closterium sp. NIES-53]
MAGLTQLQQISINGCDSLEILPESICFLLLSCLSISYCRSLTSLPHHIGALSHLETLNLLDLGDIRALPESLGNLPRLKTLELDLPALEHLPESFCESSLPACLEKLSLSRCEKLQELPPSLYTLTRLKSLHIELCSLIESLTPLTPPNPPEGSERESESLSPVEMVITAVLGTAAVFAVMLLISEPLRTVQEIIAPASTALGIRPSVMLVPAALLAYAAARSESVVAILVSMLLVVVVLLVSLVPTAWLNPAMLLAAALLVSSVLYAGASAPVFDSAANTTEQHPDLVSASASACVSIPLINSTPNIAEQHPGLVSLTELKVSHCPRISSLPENFSFPVLHTLTLHSLGNLENLLDLSSKQLPKLQHLDLEGVGADSSLSPIDCIPGVRKGRMWLLLHAKPLFLLLKLLDLVLQLVLLWILNGCWVLRGACSWSAGLAQRSCRVAHGWWAGEVEESGPLVTGMSHNNSV